MNKKMFKRLMGQAKITIDCSPFPKVSPNSVKLLKDNNFVAYHIDENLNKTLITETDNENKLYKEILKYLGIKLDHSGNVKQNKR